ncbi:hypothetical protein L3Q82_014129 [Scortum barcoo]|uniref:Uncharacterized protein n=1 Tax=Scortum barcoo TaxID=214431 RepID=A0ACB8VW81_9TELE|nr:hypothetical protein L3Q82_014129 [Scortum barcoo]
MLSRFEESEGAFKLLQCFHWWRLRMRSRENRKPAVDRPWKGNSLWQRGGGRQQQSPQPRPMWSWLSAGRARPPGDAHGCRKPLFFSAE